MIYVECKPDKLLVQTITGWPGREIIHENDKYQVMKTLSRKRNGLAMVDEDPNSNQPAYLSKMQVTEEFRGMGLRVLSDESRGNRAIVLCPRLEEWVIRGANEARISLTDPRYNLSNSGKALHDVINMDLRKFDRLVEDLAGTPRFRALRELLQT